MIKIPPDTSFPAIYYSIQFFPGLKTAVYFQFLLVQNCTTHKSNPTLALSFLATTAEIIYRLD